MAGQPG